MMCADCYLLLNYVLVMALVSGHHVLVMAFIYVA